MTDRQMYAETQHHAAMTGPQMDKLRKEIGESAAAAKREKDRSLRVRHEQETTRLQHLLHAAETVARDEMASDSTTFDARYIRTENIRSDGVECAPCVPYFETTEPEKPKAKNTAPPSGGPPVTLAVNAGEPYGETMARVRAEMKRRAAAA